MAVNCSAAYTDKEAMNIGRLHCLVLMLAGGLLLALLALLALLLRYVPMTG